MAQQTIDVGATPNDGTGDPIRDAFEKVNVNFTELYSALGVYQPLDADLTAIAALTTTSFGRGLLTLANAGALLAAAGAQAASARLTTLAGVTPISDGAHTVGTNTITTSGGLITSIT
jgi:hypothetical protein